MEDVLINEPADGLELMIAQTAESCFEANSGQAVVTPMGGTTGYVYEWSNGTDMPTADGLAPQNYTVTVTDGNNCTATESINITELSMVEISNINFSLPSCNGVSDGAITIVPQNITGGAGEPFTYNWSNGVMQEFNANLAGDQAYTVTITDSEGCTGVGVQFLNEPLPLTFDIAAEDVACFQDATGTATVSNVQLNPQRTVDSYQWGINAAGQTTPIATDLSAGEYFVTITDSEGCTAENAVMVVEPDDIDVNFNVLDNPCFGNKEGEIVANPEGGVPGYSFAWEGVAQNTGKLTDLFSNTYYLTITDNNGCEHIDSAKVEQPEQIDATINPTDVTCFGDRDGMVQLTPIGGTAPYKYSRDGENFFGSSTLIGLTEGDYEITISDANGCTTEKFATVGTPDLFTVDITDGTGVIDNSTIAFGESINAEGISQNNQGNVDYFWSASYCGTMMCPTADTTDCSGEVTCNNPILTPNNPITYTIVGIDEAGCEATSNLVIFVEKTRNVLVPTGFAPNGNSGLNQSLHVHGKTGTSINVFRIFDRWGEMLFETHDFDINDTTVGWDGTFNGEPMPAGVYVWSLVAEFEDGMTEVYKGETTLIR